MATTPTTLRARAAEEARPLLAPPRDGPSTRPPVDDARYVRLREEIDRPQSVDGGVTDWREVASLGRALLADGLGDLLIAAYTARAAQRSAGLAGTAFALALLGGRLPVECEGASPRRRRALASALRWWTRGAEAPLRKALEASRATVTTAELEDLRALLDDVAARTRTLLGEQAPAFGELRREIDRALADATREAEIPTAQSPPDSAQPDPTEASDAVDLALPPARVSPIDAAPPAPKIAPAIDAAGSAAATKAETAAERGASVELTASPGTVAALAEATTDADLQRQLRRLGEQLLDAGDQLRRRDLRDPRAYALSRQGLWLHLAAAPPTREGKSSVPPRNPSAHRQIESLAADGAWSALIEAGERLLRRSRLDLDLQRTLALALEALDPPASAAAAMIRQRTREFVARLPELLELCDRDGRPLASPETAAWLGEASERPAPPATPANAASSPSGAAAPQTHAETPAAEGDAPQFIRRLVSAESALRAGKRELAGLLFAGLDAQLERHDLQRWRPDLARRVLAGRVLTSDEAPTRAAAARRLGALCPEALAATLAPKSSPR